MRASELIAALTINIATHGDGVVCVAAIDTYPEVDMVTGTDELETGLPVHLIYPKGAPLIELAGEG